MRKLWHGAVNRIQPSLMEMWHWRKHAEVVVVTNMVELDQVTGYRCVQHGVRHAKCVASKTTSRKSACQRVMRNEVLYDISRMRKPPWMPTLCTWYLTQQPTPISQAITTVMRRLMLQESHSPHAQIRGRPGTSPPPGLESTLIVVRPYAWVD